LKKLSYLLVLATIVIVFRNWITPSVVSSGDWNFRFEEQIRSFPIRPYVWGYFLDNIGGNNNVILGLHTYFLATSAILSRYLNLSFLVIERLMWFWPFVILSFFSSWFLLKTIIPNNKFLFLSPFIFILNTHILMLIGGGQMGVAMAYSLSPLVLAFFILIIEETRFNPKLVIPSGIILSLQLIFDIRIFYITVFSTFLYFFISQFKIKNLVRSIEKFTIVFIPQAAIAFLINAFWVLPFLITGKNLQGQFGEIYSTSGAVKFFSFAKLEQAISLLHPYWPENIFGKVGFMKSEFIALPLIAFSCLLFLNKEDSLRQKANLIFFTLLGLIGSFLAKGANEPFGDLYLWAFNNIPGFILFRDPTKWYLLTAIAYSVLIPMSISKIFDWLKLKNNISFLKFHFQFKSKLFNFQNAFLVLVLTYLFFIIWPAWTGNLDGTFKKRNVPNEYIKLKNFLSKDVMFYRTFWVPSYQRFGFRSDTHPSVSGQDFLNKYNRYDVVRYLEKTASQEELQNLAVEYIVVPFDSQGEIFLYDRKYDNAQYLKTIERLSNNSFLKRIDDFGKISVFKIPNPKDHFWSPSSHLKINYKYLNPTKYTLDIKNAKEGDILVFSEGFDSLWQAQGNDFKINSEVFNGKFNSFKLPENGDYSLTVYYTPQDWVNLGVVTSVISVLSVTAILIGFKLRKW